MIKKYLFLVVIIYVCSLKCFAYTETITVPIDKIYKGANQGEFDGGEMIFELLIDDSDGEKYLTLQANDISGKQIFGHMMEGTFRCVHQKKDFVAIGRIILDSDVAEVRASHTFIPKDEEGTIWRFAVIAIYGKPTYYEISEWEITSVDDGQIHYKKTGKRATIEYTGYKSIMPILNMIHKAEEKRILRIEEGD